MGIAQWRKYFPMRELTTKVVKEYQEEVHGQMVTIRRYEVVRPLDSDKGAAPSGAPASYVRKFILNNLY